MQLQMEINNSKTMINKFFEEFYHFHHLHGHIVSSMYYRNGHEIYKKQEPVQR